MKDLADKIKESEKQISDLQTLWQQTTKPLILKELEKIKTELGLDIYISINDSTINHESIYISFGHKPSGLSYKKDDFFNLQEGRSGFILKNGANLFYSIGYRGEVTVWMQYPSIDNVIWKENDYNEIRKVKQSDINETTVRKDVEHFLDQVIKWNSGEVGTEKIGFKISHS